MFSHVARALASLSLAFKQPLSSFCDLATTDDGTLVGKRGERVTFVRVQGLRRMTLREDVERVAEGLRLDLSGSLETPGHAIQAWYACDPDLSGPEIDRHLRGARTVARELGMRLGGIFSERERLWPRIMRWEACYLVLWSKPSLLNREERKQAAEEQKKLTAGAPAIGDAQSPFQANEILSARHNAFMQRVVAAFRNHDVSVQLVPARRRAGGCARGRLPGNRGQRLKTAHPGHRPDAAHARRRAGDQRRRPCAVAGDRGPAILRRRDDARREPRHHRRPRMGRRGHDRGAGRTLGPSPSWSPG